MVADRYLRGAEHVGLRAGEAGELRELRREGTIVARACAFEDRDAFTAESVMRLSADFDPEDREAAEWTAAEIAGLARGAGDRVDYMVESEHFPDILPELFGLGLGLSARLHMGKCEDVLRANRGLDIDQRCADADVTLRSARPADVAEMVELNRVIFTEQPEHCWFGAHPAYLTALHASLAELSHDEQTGPRIFERDGEIIGWYSHEPSADSQWGPSGGMGILFGPAASGRGLLRVVYLDVAKRLLAAGTPWFRGGTSQPAVLHLGSVHGRRTIGAHVRGKHWFPPSHFGLGEG